jgi:hypothetical protein
MRNIIVALAMISATAVCFPDQSVALAPMAPSGLNPAIEAAKITETVIYSCRLVRRCGPSGCEWHRICPRGCPDGISCSPLYGAYGPWGGQPYWGSYNVPYYNYYLR